MKHLAASPLDLKAPLTTPVLQSLPHCRILSGFKVSTRGAPCPERRFLWLFPLQLLRFDSGITSSRKPLTSPSLLQAGREVSFGFH